jgi:hypothetical protein
MALCSRPIALATHGNYDRPSWQCHEWQRLLGARAFVLCPLAEIAPADLAIPGYGRLCDLLPLVSEADVERLE